jgi:hypothetical protein
MDATQRHIAQTERDDKIWTRMTKAFVENGYSAQIGDLKLGKYALRKRLVAVGKANPELLNAALVYVETNTDSERAIKNTRLAAEKLLKILQARTQQAGPSL